MKLSRKSVKRAAGGVLLGVLCAPLPSAMAQGSTIESHAKSTEGAKAVLIELIDLNDKQALQTPRARQLFSGEAANWKHPSFGKLAPSPDKILMVTETSAVGRIQWYGENDQVTDFYFYLEAKDGVWKITAMRALALTGVPELIYLNLKAKDKRTGEEENDFRNLQLLLAPDARLKEWFEQNRAQLDKLSRLVSAEGAASVEAKTLLKQLNLSGAYKQGDGNVLIVIGGMVDNTVGFLFCPTNTPPAIDPSEYIWVEQLADKWFLFRTT